MNVGFTDQRSAPLTASENLQEWLDKKQIVSMKINSGGNLRGIIITTCDYTYAKAENSLTHHPNRSEPRNLGGMF